LVIDKEPVFAFHTTGRSAAQYIPSYGPPAVQALTRASLDFLMAADDDFETHPLLSPRQSVLVADTEQGELAAQALAEGPGMEALSPDDACKLFPLLRRDRLAAAVIDRWTHDIDVAALHQRYLRQARRADAMTQTRCMPSEIRRDADRWTVRLGDETVSAEYIVNAAGAWGDRVAEIAGIAPLGLRPLRRTAFMTRGSAASARWPMVLDIDEQWYVKPDGEQFLCSPADETPSEPCDAKPEELDIALGIARINERTLMDIRSVRSSWAGLRTFSQDGVPVAGPDSREETFIWLVGQGGYGIQTSPAMALLAAAAIRHETPEQLSDTDVDPQRYLPSRFQTSLDR
jgi:D-arginine dehydrogenase